MIKVVYKGPSDIRNLSGEDLAKKGIEGFPNTSFHKDVATSVSDDVAEALIFNPNLFGKFVTEEKPAPPVAADQPGVEDVPAEVEPAVKLKKR